MEYQIITQMATKSKIKLAVKSTTQLTAQEDDQVTNPYRASLYVEHYSLLIRGSKNSFTLKIFWRCKMLISLKEDTKRNQSTCRLSSKIKEKSSWLRSSLLDPLSRSNSFKFIQRKLNQLTWSRFKSIILLSSTN